MTKDDILKQRATIMELQDIFNQCSRPILSMLVSCYKKEFPYPSMEEDLDEAFSALNSLICSTYALIDIINEDLLKFVQDEPAAE